MKKRIGSLLLILALCFTLLPTAAFAEENEQSSKTSIKTVDELFAFARAVNKGEYNQKTDAVISLEADLDLAGLAWEPIGYPGESEDEYYFSGKFYGNGHTISNIDFSAIYEKDIIGGFFGDLEGAEVSGLTITGKVDVTTGGNRIFFGAVAGWASDSIISNCTSKVLFSNNGAYIYGPVGLCGWADNTVIEYCQNKGNINITGDMSSLYVGGIVGYAGGTSEVRYCANTGDITVNAPHAGGIAGQISENAKITNCYSIGKLTPLGKGYGDIGGIAGTVWAGAEIKHCYFAGEMDLSQYTATKPYKRLGGLVGKVESGTPVFENNYYTATENVDSCGTSTFAAGTAKAIDSMKTQEFYDKLTQNGGDYRFNPNGTPLLPGPKYTVTFTVSPAELTNVVITANGQPLTNGSIDLEAGVYPVTVTADNCEPFSADITITADTATHAQTLTLTYKPADYTKVDAAIAKANALNKDNYMDFSGVEAAVNAVVRGKNITEQSEVDAMAKAIEDAINALVWKSSGGGSSSPSYSVTIPNKTENGTVTVSPRSAEKGDTVTITAKPDSGYQLDDLTVTDKNGKELKLTDKGNGKYTFTMPASKVEIKATFVKEVETSPFSDVSTSAYYYEAVKWAQEKGITGGIGNGLFGPNQPCTRAQIVTFLWRAAGSPEPKAMSSFADVSTDAYYAKAVAWAVENGITTGTGDGKFSPDATCTRAQSVTFLFRAIGKLVDSKAEFSDVLTDSYYANAVAWAVENGVTNGIGDGLFGPDNSCTRAQIVTFLFRAYQGK